MTDSRAKGKRAEAEFAAILTQHGIDFSREQDGRSQPCDFRFLDTRTEVRRREQLRVVAWANEIEAKTPAPELPVLAFRTNGEPWRVVLPLGDFLDLLTEQEDEG